MRDLLRRVAFLLNLRRRVDELAEELAFHREMKQRDLEASGLDSDSAQLAARRALGNDLSARERAQDVWFMPWLRDAVQDMRFAGRLLVKERAFALLAVAALGLGIGVNHTMFSIVNAFCIRGLPIGDVDRVVFISTRDTSGRAAGLSFAEFEDVRDSMHSAMNLSAYVVAPAALRDEGRPADRVFAAYVSATTFSAIGATPIRGRDFRASDDAPRAEPVVILGNGVWRTRYGRDDAIVGRSVIVNGAAVTVIGVMPDRFGFPNNAEVWLPLATSPVSARGTGDARTISAIGRLAPAATIAQARAEVDAIGQRLANGRGTANAGVRMELVPINERFLAQLTHPAWLAFLTAGFVVVLIACANVANLLPSRAIARTREIRRAMWQIAVGLAFGILGTYAWDRLFGLGRLSQPHAVASAAALLAAIALTACLVPANRAARLDALVALRSE